MRGYFTTFAGPIKSDAADSDATKGECFMASASDDPCFSVSTFDMPCFFIKYEEDEEEEPIFNDSAIDATDTERYIGIHIFDSKMFVIGFVDGQYWLMELQYDIDFYGNLTIVGHFQRSVANVDFFHNWLTSSSVSTSETLVFRTKDFFDTYSPATCDVISIDIPSPYNILGCQAPNVFMIGGWTDYNTGIIEYNPYTEQNEEAQAGKMTVADQYGNVTNSDIYNLSASDGYIYQWHGEDYNNVRVSFAGGKMLIGGAFTVVHTFLGSSIKLTGYTVAASVSAYSQEKVQYMYDGKYAGIRGDNSGTPIIVDVDTGRVLDTSSITGMYDGAMYNGRLYVVDNTKTIKQYILSNM